MLEIDFYIIDDEKSITGFELGSVKVKTQESFYFLEDSQKYFMVFLTIIDLLDGVNSLFNTKRKNELSKKIIAIDSSFNFKIAKNKNSTVKFYVMDTYLGDFDKSYFAERLYSSCVYFYKKYENKFTSDNSVKYDIEESIKSFKLLMLSLKSEN